MINVFQNISPHDQGQQRLTPVILTEKPWGLHPTPQPGNKHQLLGGG